MINIGPWWLYDIMAFSIIIGTTIWGIKRGCLLTFYFLIVEVIAVILLMFIPALIVNSLNPVFMQLWVKIGIVNIFSALGNSISGILEGVLEDGAFLPLDASGTTYEILKTISALGLYVVFSILIFIIINIIGLACYRPFRRWARRFVIVGSVDTFIGAFNGLALGMTLSMSISFIASFPLFQTETQKLGLVDYSNMTSDEIIAMLSGGTAYEKYSLSRKISSPMPTIPILGFTYTNACLTKYVINPTKVIVSQSLADQSLSGMKDFFLVYEDLMVDGYSTSSIFSSPISTCIDIMPQDSKSFFRIVTEMMLFGSTIFVSGTNTTKSAVTSVQLINALDKYYLSTGASSDNLHSSWLTSSKMSDFYSWAETNSETNPFIKLAENIDAAAVSAGFTTTRYLSTVLRDPTLTYNFFRNINYVNAVSRNNLDSMPYLSTIYTATYLIDGLEIVPSGELKLGEFNDTISTTYAVSTLNNITDITEQQDWWRTNYKDTYWIQYYFDFAKDYFN